MERESNGGRGRQADLAGSEEFYQSAYARLVGQLFSVTGSLEQAEDVVQEAFIRALDRWPRIQAYDVPELWVRRVAINLAVSEIRRLRRRAAALLRLGAQRPQPQMRAAAVERCSTGSKERRGLAIRYDKTPPGNLAERHLSGVVIWLRSLR
ncbi:sigma factor [Streptomyces mirabilis]|uniref:sigma factor n=1 Tax=Streptomyces mirabilis TaxID=68239 RepID=UPI0036619FE1